MENAGKTLWTTPSAGAAEAPLRYPPINNLIPDISIKPSTKNPPPFQNFFHGPQVIHTMWKKPGKTAAAAPVQKEKAIVLHVDKNAYSAVENKAFHMAKQNARKLSTLSTAYYKHHRIILLKYYFENKKKEEYIVNMERRVDGDNVEGEKKRLAVNGN